MEMMMCFVIGFLIVNVIVRQLDYVNIDILGELDSFMYNFQFLCLYCVIFIVQWEMMMSRKVYGWYVYVGFNNCIDQCQMLFVVLVEV